MSILTDPSTCKQLYQVIFDGMSSLLATGGIAQPCMRLFNVAASWPCPPLPFKGYRDVY